MARGPDFSGTVDEQWLLQHHEAIIEPDLPIVDPHHHLWNRPGSVYLFPELLADLSSGHNVRATVFEECGSMYRAEGPEELRSLGETEFVTGVAAMSASGSYGATRACVSIVGNVNLLRGAHVEPILEAHLAAAGGRFHAIRFSTAWNADERIHNTVPRAEILAEAKFREGFKYLEQFGLTFDAWVYHPQLSEVAALAAAFPQTRIVLNHFGSPILGGPNAGRTAEVFAEWRAGMTALARHENVHVKLGRCQSGDKNQAINSMLHLFRRKRLPQRGGRSSRSVWNSSGHGDVCSRVTFRCKSGGAAIVFSGTRASASRLAPPVTRKLRSLARPRSAYIKYPTG